MRSLVILIVTSFFFLTGFSQSQNLSLTAKNLKKLFNTPQYFSNGLDEIEWAACYNADGNYYKADTVQLYSDKYHYLTTQCCYNISWIFDNSNTFTIIETKVCQEPPISMSHLENCNLKIKFKNKGGALTMLIYKNRKLKDKFLLFSLNSAEMKNGELGYRLTLVRQN